MYMYVYYTHTSGRLSGELGVSVCGTGGCG